MVLLFELIWALSNYFPNAPKWLRILLLLGYILLVLILERYGKNIRDDTGITFLKNTSCLPGSLMVLCDAATLLCVVNFFPWARFLLFLAPLVEIIAFIAFFRQAKAQVRHPFPFALAQTVFHQCLSIPFALLAALLCGLLEKLIPHRIICACIVFAFCYGLFELWKSKNMRYELKEKGYHILHKNLFLLLLAVALSCALVEAGIVLEAKPVFIMGVLAAAATLIASLVFLILGLKQYGRFAVVVAIIRLLVYTAAILFTILITTVAVIIVSNEEMVTSLITNLAVLFSASCIVVIAAVFLYYLLKT